MHRRMEIITILLFVVTVVSYSQVAQTLAMQADSAYQQGKYAESASLYARAVAAGATEKEVFYNAACSYALSGNKDSAFFYMGKSVDHGWSDAGHLKEDSDLSSLHSDARWNRHVEKAETNRRKTEPVDSLIYHLNNLSAVSYQYRVKPKENGGGGGSYTGFVIPKGMKSTRFGTFSAKVASADTIRFVATSTVKKGSVSAMLDVNGRLSGFKYSGELK